MKEIAVSKLKINRKFTTMIVTCVKYDAFRLIVLSLNSILHKCDKTRR